MPHPIPRSVLLYATGHVFVVRSHHLEPDTIMFEGEEPVRVYRVKAASDTSAVMQALAQENCEHRKCDEQNTPAQNFYETCKPYGEVFVQSKPTLKEIATGVRQISVKKVQVP